MFTAGYVKAAVKMMLLCGARFLGAGAARGVPAAGHDGAVNAGELRAPWTWPPAPGPRP